MGKEKKRNFEETKKEETLFYYELIGVITIVLSITILGKLGKIGSLFTIFFKVAFGDWYWFFLIFVLFLGFYSLFKHQKFPIKNQRFIGVVFISLGLLTFAHFPVHNYVIQLEGNYLSNTWFIYNKYINSVSDSFLGGGIIGATIFFIIYYLLGSVGVVLLGTFIIIFGFSLVINKSIIDIIKFSFDKVKKAKKYTTNFNEFFKYELGKRKNIEEKNIFSKSQMIALKGFDDLDNSMITCLQDKISDENKSLIQSILNNMHIEYKLLDVIKSYAITTYKYLLFSEYNEKNIINRLKNVVEDNILYCKENNTFIFQINNKHMQILNMRNLLQEQTNLLNNYYFPMGIAYDNSLITMDLISKNELLIVSENIREINNYLLYFIFGLFVKQDLINYTIELYDADNNLKEIENLIPNKSNYDLINYLDILIKEIDERNDILTKNNAISIDEYNNVIDMTSSKEKKIKRKFIILNDIKINNEYNAYLENKIMYIIQIGLKCGFFIITTTTNIEILSSVILSVFTRRLIFKCSDLELSTRIMQNENAKFLYEKEDAFYVVNGKSIRIRTPFVSTKDIEYVKRSLK